jgi:hypothetical protein
LDSAADLDSAAGLGSGAAAGAGSGVDDAAGEAGAAAGVLDAPDLDDFDDLDVRDFAGAAWTAGASSNSAERTPQQTRESGWIMVRGRRECDTEDSGSGGTRTGEVHYGGEPSSRVPTGRGRREGQRGISRDGGGTGSA